jgi:hypothetical protein
VDLEAARFESGQSPSCGRADAGESDLPVKQVPMAERVRIPPPAQHPTHGPGSSGKERDAPNVGAAGSNPAIHCSQMGAGARRLSYGRVARFEPEICDSWPTMVAGIPRSTRRGSAGRIDVTEAARGVDRDMTRPCHFRPRCVTQRR